ncbi:hypothetical protein TrLO_g5518 [Triparma laevis f. longispina]|uniref:CNNM transmembrane domain-containing protein n=1 Tax=Triparma laevis f. longispina TaxID=1714387 RepID=A0A9W7B1F9_9STRA|nr:hypothetical protein TrLO_g5518 [Triparma laevis f. longispina]
MASALADIDAAVAFLASAGVGACCELETCIYDLPLCPASALSRYLEEEEPLSPTGFYLCLAGTATCMVMAALAAGLTMGLLSIDPLELTIKQKCGSDEEKRIANALLPLIERHHLMLVTLLLYNAGANECLPLFLDKMVPSYIAIILSVTIVLFFGEIFPSAIFTGPSQLRIAYYLSPVVKFLMTIVFPITYPIAWCLDYALGHSHGVVTYSRRELQALVEIQHEEGIRKKTEGSAAVTYDEATIIAGALAITTTTAADAMTKLKNMSCHSTTETLDEDTIADIYRSGFSRIPVYEPNPRDSEDQSRVKGYMFMKQLVVIDPSVLRSIGSIPLRIPLCVRPDVTLDVLLNMFQRGGAGMKGGHLALVCHEPALAQAALEKETYIPKESGLMGMITMEDVIEELLQEEIYDETDVVEMMAMKKAKKVISKWRNFMQKKKIERGEDPGTIREFGNAVSAAAAKSRRESRSKDEEDEDMEFGRGASKEPLLKKSSSKKSSWYGM